METREESSITGPVVNARRGERERERERERGRFCSCGSAGGFFLCWKLFWGGTNIRADTARKGGLAGGWRTSTRLSVLFRALCQCSRRMQREGSETETVGRRAKRGRRTGREEEMQLVGGVGTAVARVECAAVVTFGGGTRAQQAGGRQTVLGRSRLAEWGLGGWEGNGRRSLSQVGFEAGAVGALSGRTQLGGLRWRGGGEEERRSGGEGGGGGGGGEEGADADAADRPFRETEGAMDGLGAVGWAGRAGRGGRGGLAGGRAGGRGRTLWCR